MSKRKAEEQVHHGIIKAPYPWKDMVTRAVFECTQEHHDVISGAMVTVVKEYIRDHLTPDNSYDIHCPQFKSYFNHAVESLQEDGIALKPNMARIKLTPAARKAVKEADYEANEADVYDYDDEDDDEEDDDEEAGEGGEAEVYFEETVKETPATKAKVAAGTPSTKKKGKAKACR